MDNFFLIDTNIWIGILKEDSKDYLLNSLQLLTKENKIKLLIPAILLEEWNVQKNKQLEHFKKTYATTIEMSTHSGSQILKPQLNNEVEQAQRKIEKIELLLKKGDQIKVSSKVKVATVDRSKLKKAPFHNKIFSINDSLMYLSVIEYLKKKNISEFIFVSRNSKDFCQPGTEYQLHTDLIFDGIKTWYFNELGAAFHYFKEKLPLPEKSLFFKQKDYIIELIEPAGLDIVSHLHETLSKAVEQLEFIPTSILVRLSPFRIKHPKREFSYHENFGLYINNEAVIDFFKALEIGKVVRFKKGSGFRNTKDNIAKITDIINFLNNNQVYSIISVHDNAETNIQIKHTVYCDCVRCSYMKLNLSTSLLKIQNSTTNISDRIKAAYVLYRFGLYKRAIQQFYEIYLEAKEKNMNIIAYRMACNLLWLRDYMYFYSDADMQKIATSINNINLNLEYYSFANASEYEQEIASFYYQGNFHYHYADQISTTTDKIIQHFESQLRGYYGSNSNYSNLVNYYSEFENFINLNCLAFLRFSDFRRVFSKYAEGILLSFFLNDYQGGRPLYINDYNLIQLVIYGDFKEIGKLYGKLSSNLIKYKAENRSFFKELVHNFFTDASTFKKSIEAFDPKSNEFNREYETIFLNILVLLSIVDLDKRFLKNVNSLIFSFINENELKNYELTYLGWFIKRVGSLLSTVELHQYFLLFVNDEKFHSEDLFCYFPEVKEGFFIDNKADFDCVANKLLEKCSKCRNHHHTLLFSASNLLAPSFKQELKIKIENQFADEMNEDLFFYSAMSGIIDVKKFFPLYLEKFKPLKIAPVTHAFFGQGEITYRKFNDLLNVAFQFNIQLSNEFIANFKGMSLYYDWLIDMNGFNYSKFNPLWLLQYATSVYLKRALSVPQVRKAVKSYLRQHHQPQLARYYASHVD